MTLIQKKAYDNALQEFETTKKMKGEKELPLVHKYLGGIYWSKKQYDLAVAELETYVKLVPDGKDVFEIRKTIAELKDKKN
jgi:outer membrane protein assembly factor BamD (BamD/ComL family)